MLESLDSLRFNYSDFLKSKFIYKYANFQTLTENSEVKENLISNSKAYDFQFLEFNFYPDDSNLALAPGLELVDRVENLAGKNQAQNYWFTEKRDHSLYNVYLHGHLKLGGWFFFEGRGGFFKKNSEIESDYSDIKERTSSESDIGFQFAGNIGLESHKYGQIAATFYREVGYYKNSGSRKGDVKYPYIMQNIEFSVQLYLRSMIKIEGNYFIGLGFAISQFTPKRTTVGVSGYSDSRVRFNIGTNF